MLCRMQELDGEGEILNILRDVSDLESESTGKTAIEKVYAALRQDVLNGVLEPESRLRVQELRERFEVGSSTIREALSRLLVDNLVTSEGQRGFRVAPISIKDFREISELRVLLECQAVRESLANADDVWENRLVAAAHQLAKVERDLPQKRSDADYLQIWETRNAEFHEALVAGCSNAWLSRFRAQVFAHSVRYRRIVLSDRNTQRDVRSEHEKLFEAALARDVETAVEATANHIRESVAVLEAKLADLPKLG